jgi:hypothetical protein
MIGGLLLGTAMVPGVAGVRPAAAQLGEGRNVTCESSGRLVRQVSNAPCLQGETWGFERNAMWVDHGCRGEFEVVLADGGRRAE